MQHQCQAVPRGCATHTHGQRWSAGDCALGKPGAFGNASKTSAQDNTCRRLKLSPQRKEPKHNRLAMWSQCRRRPATARRAAMPAPEYASPASSHHLPCDDGQLPRRPPRQPPLQRTRRDTAAAASILRVSRDTRLRQTRSTGTPVDQPVGCWWRGSKSVNNRRPTAQEEARASSHEEQQQPQPASRRAERYRQSKMSTFSHRPRDHSHSHSHAHAALPTARAPQRRRRIASVNCPPGQKLPVAQRREKQGAAWPSWSNILRSRRDDDHDAGSEPVSSGRFSCSQESADGRQRKRK